MFVAQTFSSTFRMPGSTWADVVAAARFSSDTFAAMRDRADNLLLECNPWSTVSRCANIGSRTFGWNGRVTPEHLTPQYDDLNALVEELFVHYATGSALRGPEASRLTDEERSAIREYVRDDSTWEPSVEAIDARLGPPWCRRVDSDGSIPNAYDPLVAVSGLMVNVAPDHCFGGASPEILQDTVYRKLASLLPRGIASAIRDKLLQPNIVFSTVDFPLRRCDCDYECAEFDVSRPTNPFGEGTGGRHRCVERKCYFQLEMDRVVVRPEGLDIVLSEDEHDPQTGLLAGWPPVAIVAASGLCDWDRGRSETANASIPMVLPPATIRSCQLNSEHRCIAEPP